MKYAIISLESNTVVNLIELEPTSKWLPPNNHIIVANNDVHMGWSYSNNQFVVPPVVIPENTKPPANLLPKSVSPLQIRKALNSLGLRKEVEDYVKTLGQDAIDAWEYANQIDRDNPLISQVGTNFNKTSEDIDDIFRLASSF